MEHTMYNLHLYACVVQVAITHTSTQALQEVHRLSEQLGQPDASLPHQLVQHAPPQSRYPHQGAPLEDLLRASGKPAAHQLAMWRQAHGGRRKAHKGVDADPYVVCEVVVLQCNTACTLTPAPFVFM